MPENRATSLPLLLSGPPIFDFVPPLGASSARLRASAVVGFALVLAAQVACSGEEGPSSGAASSPHADLRERLAVEPDREIHQITIGGRGEEEHVVPTLLRLSGDDIVVFTTVDGRVHTLSFPRDSLALDAALFLERTDQMDSPPLTDRGSRFVVTLEGAPEGRYPFRSRGPGGEAWGTLVVGDAVEDGSSPPGDG